ncbi:MAG: hypothetical protein SH850_06265 [Planctomycetaceae bacterium]|nr:hypothetical protein [Planctomycetaceae bacterium]
MPPTTSPQMALAEQLLEEIDDILFEAEEQTRPLEVEPFRGRLFELFVTAEGAGCVRQGAEPDLTADGLCRQLADRMGLTEAARDTMGNLPQLPPEQVAKMRLLWSLLRMWMEWTYAWQRWAEFHGESQKSEV